MILETLEVDAATLEARTGWAIKPEGACYTAAWRVEGPRAADQGRK